MKKISLFLLSSVLLLNAKWDHEVHYQASLAHTNYLVEKLNKAENLDQRMDYARWLGHATLGLYGTVTAQYSAKDALDNASENLNSPDQNFMVNNLKKS